MRLGRHAVAVALAVLAAASLHGEDNAPNDKALSSALDDLEKELRAKNEEPTPELELLAHVAGKVGVAPKEALALVRDVRRRKIPPMVALAASLEREKESDPKKWLASFKKWTAGWTSPIISSHTFYVAPEGDDGGAGSRESPWKTLQYAVKTAPAGSVLLLRGGTYTETVSCERPLAFRAYRKETPRVVAPAGAAAGPALSLGVGASGSELVGLEIVATGPAQHPDLWFAAVSIESEGTATGSNKRGWTSCTDVLVERCKIQGAINVNEGCDRCIVTRCELYGPKGAAFWCLNAGFVILQDCHIHDTGTGATFSGGVIRSIVERNLIENVRDGLELGEGVGAGFPFFTLARQPGEVLYESIDCVARNNVIVRSKGVGIRASSSLRPRIENNTILDAASETNGGILLCGVRHDSAEAPYPKEPQKTKDASVVNNVVAVSLALPAVLLGKDTEGALFANNCYSGTKGAPAFWEEALEKPHHGTFDEWSAQVPGGDRGSFVQDPGLLPDHTPGPGSPCLHAGQALVGFVDDFAGRRRKAWDLGAVGALAEPAKK